MKQKYSGFFRAGVMLLVALAGTSSIKAQILSIPYDATAVTVDGTLQAVEWQVAQKVFIRTTVSDSIEVRLKHDMANLHIAFIGNLESANALFPEVLIDPHLTRSNAWMPGQWWFHVSATDCEHHGGAYGVYTNCKLIQPDWEGAPNFVSGAPFTDTVEIKIPFIKIGFDPLAQDTLGLSFVTTNTFSAWHIWPAAADRNVPGSWSTAVISKPVTSIPQEPRSGQPLIFPNPVKNVVIIESPVDDGRDKSITLTDITGKTLYASVSKARVISIPTAELSAGLYLICVRAGDDYYRYKIVKTAE